MMTCFVDCPESMLGSIEPSKIGLLACNEQEHATLQWPQQNNGAVVNGVFLPQHVIEELRRLGLPLGWYNAGELEDAVIACAFDETLIDDDEGANFHDMLSLTNEEKLAHDRKRKFRSFTSSNCNQDDDNFLGL
jgi:hypothetical protein